MTTQAQLNSLFESLTIRDEHRDKLNELKQSFDENHVEEFLHTLETIDNIDEIFQESEDSSEQSNQFIDFVSELIINNKKI